LFENLAVISLEICKKIKFANAINKMRTDSQWWKWKSFLYKLFQHTFKPTNWLLLKCTMTISQ